MSCRDLRETAFDEEAAIQNKLNETHVTFAGGRKAHAALLDEIASLKSRRSNIDARQVAMRSALCDALQIVEDDMPFAGELIQVRDDEKDWEGVVERLLHAFGLSLLVPDAHYSSVADWVDRTNLKGRLVYYRVRDARPSSRSDLSTLHRQSLAHKVNLKPDSPFFRWLEHEITHRFDFACCGSQEQFRRETRAVTRAGQIKAPGERHDKDDRTRLEDRSHYVLGWSNAAKISALETRTRALEATLRDIGGNIASLQARQRSLKERLETLGKLDEYRDFRDLDWIPLAADIARLQEEKRALEATSDLLKTLTQQLDAIVASIAATETALKEHEREHAQTTLKQEQARTLLGQIRVVLEDPSFSASAAYFSRTPGSQCRQARSVSVG
jgi:uncharacterized protein YPO0396